MWKVWIIHKNTAYFGEIIQFYISFLIVFSNIIASIKNISLIMFFFNFPITKIYLGILCSNIFDVIIFLDKYATNNITIIVNIIGFFLHEIMLFHPLCVANMRIFPFKTINNIYTIPHTIHKIYTFSNISILF